MKYKDRHARVERVCEWCGNTFMARVERVNVGQGRFCSLAHANLFQTNNDTKNAWGKENGKKYWDGTKWVVHWRDGSNKVKVTSYQKWWWELNVGDVPTGYVVSFLDENPDNISPDNFYLVTRKELGAKYGSRHKGFRHSDESKSKMSKAREGKPLSDSHRENIGKSVKRRWESGEYDNTLFIDISGDKNPGWRGGVGQEYPEEFSRALKKFIWSRDNNTCQICGTQVSRKGVFGHVHHIDGNKDNNVDNNLILLCVYCHSKIHKSNDISSPVIMAFRSKLEWNK